MPTSVDFSKRTEVSHLREPIRQLTVHARQLGTDLFVVGAVARDIAFYSWKLPPPRATTDIDVAVAVPNWSVYEELRDQFERVPGQATHRVLVGGAVMDLVPFGGVEDGSRSIAWPPDRAFVMSVLGFAEARRATVDVRLAPDVEVAVASVPGLTALKLVVGTGNTATEK